MFKFHKLKTTNNYNKSILHYLVLMKFFTYMLSFRRKIFHISNSMFSVAFQEYEEGGLENWREPYDCLKCQPGCETCRGPTPCLAKYNWPFR